MSNSNIDPIAWINPSELDDLEGSGYGTVWSTSGDPKRNYKPLVLFADHEREIIAERIVSETVQDDLKNKIADLEEQVKNLKETNRDLNRRAQEAESKAFQNGGMVYKRFEFLVAENTKLRNSKWINDMLLENARRKHRECVDDMFNEYLPIIESAIFSLMEAQISSEYDYGDRPANKKYFEDNNLWNDDIRDLRALAKEIRLKKKKGLK